VAYIEKQLEFAAEDYAKAAVRYGKLNKQMDAALDKLEERRRVCEGLKLALATIRKGLPAQSLENSNEDRQAA